MKEIDRLISILSASMDALIATLPGNTEIVLHDLTQPKTSVVRIVNGHVSGRKQGDGLMSGPDDDQAILGLLDTSQRVPFRVFKNYTTVTVTGKPLNSASTIYYSKAGTPLVGFCINVDLDAVSRFKRDLDYLTQPFARYENNEQQAGKIPEQTLNDILIQFRQNGSESKLDFRKRVVAEIHAMGFFKIKGSVNQVAKVLNVTRYTVYNYLEKIDGKSDQNRNSLLSD